MADGNNNGVVANAAAPREFIDYVSEGLPLVQQLETNYWKLGDLAGEYQRDLCNPKDPDAPTMSDLAGAWGFPKSSVSEWKTVADFYTEQYRIWGNLSWNHYKLARKYATDIEDAMDLLQVAHEQSHSVRSFRRYLEGIYYEGKVRTSEIPPNVQGLCRGDQWVWIEVSKYTEE